VVNTPVDTQGTPGTLCGLAYPYQRGYKANPTAAYAPPHGEIFDEIYFADFAHNDLKGISYFDPEPPLAKLFIAAGEWLYGEYRVVFEGAQGNAADLGFTPFGWRSGSGRTARSPARRRCWPASTGCSSSSRGSG